MAVSSTITPARKLLYLAGFFLIVFVVVESTGLRSRLSPQDIRSLFWEYHWWGIGLFCLAFSVGNLLYIPGWIFLVGAVFALGKEWGGLATLTAGVVSSIVSYVIIRKIGGNALRTLNHRWADRVFAHLDDRPIISVTLLRLMFQTLPVLNYALALADVRFRHYLLGTVLGLPIPIFLYCYFFEIVFKQVLDHFP
ncbi:MAG: VTT domain-containing protein [Nitrospirales bacterium]|nr:VTT domain-containing protein [Nitrospirales bacterium]